MTTGADSFRRRRFGEPFRAVDTTRIAWYRRAIDEILERPGLEPRSPLQSRHLDAPVILDLCTTETIVSRVQGLLGPEIVLWRSHFFPKEPGAGALDWHRDADVWGSLLDPMINITAWLAIDDASEENGCVTVRYDDADERGTPIVLAAGECFLFDHTLPHRSGANHSTRRRLGLAMRFTLPGVRIDTQRLFPGHRQITIGANTP